VCLGVGGVVHNHNEDWIDGFSHFGVRGDALLAKLRAIRMALDFCRNQGYNNIICKSGCLEAVELFVVGRDHTLYTYATNILHIRDILHGNDNTTMVHVLREQNLCANFMAKEGSYSRCSACWDCPCLTWSLSS